MKKVRILAAEDDSLHASRLEMLLDEMGFELIDICANESDMKRIFIATKPDLVILDIGLGENGDGVSLAHQLFEIQPSPIIFATAFEDKETIARALKADPYAYLVKPVEKPSLQAAIELALYKFSNREKEVESPTEKHQGWTEDLVLTDSFFVKSGSKLLKVPHQDILWIEVRQERYCDIITNDRKFPIRSSMNLLEEKLNPATFVRIHRSHIVNIHKIDGIDDLDMTVEVGEKSLPLGGAYKNNLLNRFRLL